MDTSLRRSEEAARDIVTALLSVELGQPVTAHPWDASPRQGVHDFWITYGTNSEALEITTLAEQDTRTHAMHWQKRGPGFRLTVDGLQFAWSIMVDQTFKANKLKENLGRWLLALEEEGITDTGRWDSERIYVHPLTNALTDAGVIIASAVPGPPPGMVDLVYASDTPSRPAGDPDHIARTLTDILKLERHQADAAKLGRSGAEQRHLFFWVDTTRLDVIRAFDEGTPTMTPTVDSRITEVWLAVPTEDGADVLRWSASHGWRRDRVGA